MRLSCNCNSLHDLVGASFRLSFPRTPTPVRPGAKCSAYRSDLRPRLVAAEHEIAAHSEEQQAVTRALVLGNFTVKVGPEKFRRAIGIDLVVRELAERCHHERREVKKFGHGDVHPAADAKTRPFRG